MTRAGGSLPTETLTATRLKRKERPRICGGLGHRLGKSGLQVIHGGLVGGKFDKCGYNLIRIGWYGSFVCRCLGITISGGGIVTTEVLLFSS